MKKFICIVMLSLLFVNCGPSIGSQMDKAESIFIDEVQYMTKEDALSKEINYYKAPNISTRTHVRSLTGRDLIHECNRVIEENNNKDFINFSNRLANLTDV